MGQGRQHSSVCSPDVWNLMMVVSALVKSEHLTVGPILCLFSLDRLFYWCSIHVVHCGNHDEYIICLKCVRLSWICSVLTKDLYLQKCVLLHLSTALQGMQSLYVEVCHSFVSITRDLYLALDIFLEWSEELWELVMVVGQFFVPPPTPFCEAKSVLCSHFKKWRFFISKGRCSPDSKYVQPMLSVPVYMTEGCFVGYIHL